MLSKEKIENDKIPKQLAKALGIEKEDTDSLIAFKESLFEQTVKENVKLKKQVEQLEKENEELTENLNKKDKTIEAMRYIKNTSRYEDTILIDKGRANSTRRNKFLIELSNGEFVEVNKLKFKANAYDSLVEKIKKKLKECENLIDVSQGCMNDEDLYREYGKREILQELLDTENSFQEGEI